MERWPALAYRGGFVGAFAGLLCVDRNVLAAHDQQQLSDDGAAVRHDAAYFLDCAGWAGIQLLPVFGSGRHHYLGCCRIGGFIAFDFGGRHYRSEEHTSELQSLMRISYAVFCLKTKKLNILLYLKS